ncbi:MAG TPA: amidase, partial [Burkholderiaceae bacterium]
MKRREFVHLGLAGAAGLAAATTAGNALAASAGKTGARAVTTATVPELQAMMAGGGLTARALAQHFLDRIAAVDRAGPRLNAVIELNPDALAIAAALDAE